MAKVTQHAPGMFSWADLSTPNTTAAKKFYTSLFRWEYDHDAAGPEVNYAVAKVGDERAAALYKQGKEETKAGIPPHWNCYFTVEDIADASKKVKRAGGQLFCPPFEVFDSGRMCILGEPADAVCALWQPGAQIGATVMGEHGALGWAELQSRDPDSSLGFLVKLFGFQAETMETPNGDYTVFRVDGKPSCGMLEMSEALAEELPSLWVPYFNVDDCDVAVAAAVLGGGKQLGQALNIPQLGRCATLMDPQGATFAVVTPPSTAVS